jgi:maleylacetoacetate isomerase
VILYSYWRSSCSYRVRIALEFLNCSYEYRPIHLVKDGGEQLKEDYQKLNPMAQVPFLVDGNVQLSQSMAILEYLNAKFPEKRIIPDDHEKAAKVREVCEIINSGIQPLQNLSVLKKLVNDFGASEEQKIDWIKQAITKGFQAIEPLISDGDFCFEEFSIADALLVPQVYNAERFQLDMSAFPKIKNINEKCLQLDYFQKAEPSAQIDAQ